MNGFRVTRPPSGDLRAIVHAAAESGVLEAGLHLEGVAVQNAPIEEGTLRRSATTTTEGTTAVVSFDTPYAARQHEELTWHHPRGGGAKYLERAMSSEASVLGDIIGTAIRSRLSE